MGASSSLSTNSPNCTAPYDLCTLFHTSGTGVGRGSSSVSDAGSTAWCLKPALQKQFWMMVEEVSLQDAAIMFVACTMSRALRREFASLLFSTQARYLSASFFLYLLFAERMIPWSSGCIIEVVLGGSMRNMM